MHAVKVAFACMPWCCPGCQLSADSYIYGGAGQHLATRAAPVHAINSNLDSMQSYHVVANGRRSLPHACVNTPAGHQGLPHGGSADTQSPSVHPSLWDAIGMLASQARLIHVAR